MIPTNLLPFLLGAAARGSSGSSLTEILVILVGSGGAIGIITAFVRMPGDRSASAVSQAQGAMETMSTLNESLKQALAEEREEAHRQRQRADFYRDQLERLSLAHHTISAEAVRRGVILHPDDQPDDDAPD